MMEAADAPRAVQEYLATLDDAAFGAATPVKPSSHRILILHPSGLQRVKALRTLHIQPIT